MTEQLHPGHSIGLAGKLKRLIIRARIKLRGFARARMRDDEIGLVALAGLLGVGAGFGVVLLRRGGGSFPCSGLRHPAQRPSQRRL